jgi:hypothetical protein
VKCYVELVPMPRGALRFAQPILDNHHRDPVGAHGQTMQTLCRGIGAHGDSVCLVFPERSAAGDAAF